MEKKKFELNDSELEAVVGGREILPISDSLDKSFLYAYGLFKPNARSRDEHDAALFDVLRQECELARETHAYAQILEIIRGIVSALNNNKSWAEDILADLEEDCAKFL